MNFGEEYSRSDVSFSSHPIRGCMLSTQRVTGDVDLGHSERVCHFLHWEAPIASFPRSAWLESHSVQPTLKWDLLEGRAKIVWSCASTITVTSQSFRGDNLEAMQLCCSSLMSYLLILAFTSGSY